MRRVLILAVLTLTVLGCQKPMLSPEDYETVAKDPRRDTEKARLETAAAVRMIDSRQLDDAEKTLRGALVADVFYGPAHNDLGLVYFHQKRLYLAALEFQYAVKLMPNTTEPKNNLGMVFESIGRLEDAERCYDEALSIEPDNAQVTENLARVCVRLARKDDKTRKLLQAVVMKSDRSDWVAWARERLVTMGQSEPAGGRSLPPTALSPDATSGETPLPPPPMHEAAPSPGEPEAVPPSK
jgi:Flp pilus assembly protein TadD